MTSQIVHPPGPSHTEQFRNSNLVSSRAFLVFCKFCHKLKKGKEWERNLAVKFTFGPWRNCVFRLWVEFCTVFIVAGFDCSVRLISFPLFATSALLFPDCVDFFHCQCPPILLMNPLGLQSIQIFAFYLYHTLSRISFCANSCADCWDFPFSRGIENYHWTILFLVKKANFICTRLFPPSFPPDCLSFSIKPHHLHHHTIFHYHLVATGGKVISVRKPLQPFWRSQCQNVGPCSRGLY